MIWTIFAVFFVGFIWISAFIQTFKEEVEKEKKRK